MQFWRGRCQGFFGHSFTPHHEKNLGLVRRPPALNSGVRRCRANSCEEDRSNGERKVEAVSTFRIELAKETSPVRDANGGRRDTKGFFGQPSAEEVSRLSFGNLRDICIMPKSCETNSRIS